MRLQKKYYPSYYKKGYTFYGNTCRPVSKEYIEKQEKKSKGEERFINDSECILTGEIVVGEECHARWECGHIDSSLVPIFAKFEKK